MDATQQNDDEQTRLWNGLAGRAWVETQELLDLVRAKNVPPIPVTRQPLNKANDALVQLQQGAVVGRTVLTP